MLEIKKINGKMVKDETARNSITGLQTQINNIEVPTKTSDLTNDSDFVNSTFVTNKIAEASLNSGEVDLSGYVTKETGNAAQITFADGQTFQAKLDAGTLKGDKGDKGDKGEQGIQGPKGDKGEPGVNSINDTTPGANTTYSSNKIETIKEELNNRIDNIGGSSGGSSGGSGVAIADDVVTSRSDMALSARQGVVLSDRINNNVRSINNLSNLVTGEAGTAVTIDGSRLAYFIKSETKDYTDALNTMLASIPKRGKIIFPQGEEILLGKINPIDRPIQIDFNHCKIRPAASAADQVMFELKFNGDYYDNEGRAELINYEFMCESGDPVPQCFIQFNDAINSTVKGLFTCCKATHSLVWNLRGYGNKILGEMRRTQAPRCIYLSHDGAEDKHSFDFYIDVDVTGNTGYGIEYEGGAGEIQGVVEGCEQGGIFFNGVHISKCININTVHFEANKVFDVQLGTSEFKQGSANEGWTNLTNCYFAFPPGRYEGFVPIRLGQRQRVTMFGCSVWGDGAIVAMDCTGNGNYTGNYSNLSVFGGVQTPAKIKANIGNEYVTVGGMVVGQLWADNGNFQTVRIPNS